ncbi:MAG: outer membrane protein assembly factor BamA [Myxococcaceae bacterium]|nr:outer membrane protein assembly factor BamA [Myxococcaceae bacterium]
MAALPASAQERGATAASTPATPTTAENAAPDDEALAGEDLPANAVVKDVRVEGNRRVEAEAIKRALVTKVGQPFARNRTAEDLRALYALKYFKDVRLLVQRLPDGVAYVVRVKERPVVRDVKLAGNEEVSAEDFKEIIDIKAFSILDMDAVRKVSKKIQEKYVEKGYFLAEVSPRVEDRAGSNGAAVNIFFDVRENAKILVKQIRFLGVKKVPEAVLREQMVTKEGGLLSFLTNEGIYRDEFLQHDLAIVQTAYYDRGFVNVKVEKPHVSMSPDKRSIYITIPVVEGEQYKIGKLDVTGDLELPKEQLLRRLGSREGMMFNRSLLSADMQTLTDTYADRGYAYANVTPETAVDAEKRTVDLTFAVEKGKPVTIERIEVVGNSKTRDKVIRRELRVFEGELFSGTGMRRSKERVNALGFFETVEVTQKKGSSDDKVVLQVEVKEKATGTFQVGLGFSNVESFILTAQVQQQNFLGWGQAVSLNVQASGLRQMYQLSFFDPYFLDTDLLFSADAFKVDADYGGFLRRSTGGNVTFGRYLTPDFDLTANLTLTYEYVDNEVGSGLDQVPLAGRFRSGDTRSARLSLTWDRRDNRLFPSKGFMLSGSAEIAPGWLVGSDFRFARFAGFARFYQPLPLGATFKTNINVGYMGQLERNSPLPISEMYYLGGISSVRGYMLRSISPTLRVPNQLTPDSTIYRDYPIGGNKQFSINTELEVMLLEKMGVRGLIFYDAGNAWGTNEAFFQDKQDKLPLGLFHSVGFGVRWFSPIGPLRFEWGIPLNRRPGIDQPILFEFSIGNFF